MCAFAHVKTTIYVVINRRLSMALSMCPYSIHKVFVRSRFT